MTRVQIDLNVRTHGNWTFAGLEDADGAVAIGDPVVVFEPETGLEGPGKVEIVDHEHRLIYLSVDWKILMHPSRRLTSDAYLQCFECGHVYETRSDLVREHLARLEEMGIPATHEDNIAENIYTCAMCPHDF